MRDTVANITLPTVRDPLEVVRHQFEAWRKRRRCRCRIREALWQAAAEQAMHWIGKMGGWLARGKQDQPGTTCIWRGLTRLPSIVQGYLLALRVHGVRASP